jgi:hypothetical protein
VTIILTSNDRWRLPELPGPLVSIFGRTATGCWRSR